MDQLLRSPDTCTKASRIQELASSTTHLIGLTSTTSATPFQTRHCHLNHKEQKTAEKVAQDIVRLIVDLPVSPIQAVLGFKLDKKSKVKYRWWLKKTPTILQKNLSATDDKKNPRATDGKKNSEPSSRQERSSYRASLIPQEDKVHLNEIRGDDNDHYTPGQITKWYPDVCTALELAYERCECGCNERVIDDILEEELDSGCLLALIFSETMLHVAHAMAEAAGASDVSNLHGVDTAITLAEAAVALLGPIAKYGEIMWDTWFRLAASAITGVPYDMADEQTLDVGGGLFLWAAGSMTIIPAWFTMDSDIKLQGSWGVQQMTGSLQGLEAETAVIESQHSSTAQSTNLPSPRPISSGEDEEDVKVETAIFSNTGDLYRIMSMVRTSSTLRILNPLDVYRGAILAVRPSCTHDMIEEVMVHPWFFNDVLLGWNSHKTPISENPHIALLEHTPTKQNVAIGFAAARCVLRSEQCCFRCLAETAKEKNFYGVSCGTSNRRKKLKLG